MKMFIKKRKNLFFLFFVLFLISCDGRNKKPSFLILAVDSLSFEDIPCHGTFRESSILKSFRVLCDQAVWFTHAFTPSVMSQAALTSLLVGKYPYEHRAWDNGRSFLTEEHQSVVEKALEEGYKTAFFSGGPPIWRKSGLSQGFEVFDDFIDINFKDFYRPVLNNFKLFLKWLDRSVKSKPFFSVLYLNDLQFLESTTYTNLGRMRSLSYESQLEELGESLTFLFHSLKKKKRWKNVHIVLVGLNGRNQRNRLGEIKTYNLHSENTQVAFFFKPAKEKNHRVVPGWKVNQNVSLVDLGATLYSLLGYKPPMSVGRKKELQVISLKEALYKPGGGRENWNLKRFILLESAWPQWRKLSGSRFGVRKEHYLILFDEKIKIYNTLIDRFENVPLLETDPMWKTLHKEVNSFVKKMGFLPWKPLENSSVEKLELAQKLWGKSYINRRELFEFLETLAQKRMDDFQIQVWMASLAIEFEEWERLKKIGEKNKNLSWIHLAERRLGLKGRSHLLDGWKSKKKFETKCWEYFLASFSSKTFEDSQSFLSNVFLNHCEDLLFFHLLSWIYEKDIKKKNFYKERFFRSYLRYKRDQNLFRLNQSKFLVWDVNETGFSHLNLTELYLLLPKARQYLRQVESRMKVLLKD